MKKILTLFVALVMVLSLCACEKTDYKKAAKAYNSGDYDTAIALYESLGQYEESERMLKESKYRKAYDLSQAGEKEEALAIYEELGDYEYSKANAENIRNQLYPPEIDYTEVTFDEMYQDYKDNRVAASEKYRNMYLTLSGYVDGISGSNGANYSMELKKNFSEDNGKRVTCMIMESNEDACNQLLKIKNGDYVTVNGSIWCILDYPVFNNMYTIEIDEIIINN